MLHCYLSGFALALYNARTASCRPSPSTWYWLLYNKRSSQVVSTINTADAAAPAAAAEGAAPRTSLTGLLGSSAGAAAAGGSSLGGLGDDELVAAEPAVNLSNKLNPNNIHYDRELAAR
jgi:hypothetical protein